MVEFTLMVNQNLFADLLQLVHEPRAGPDQRIADVLLQGFLIKEFGGARVAIEDREHGRKTALLKQRFRLYLAAYLSPHADGEELSNLAFYDVTFLRLAKTLLAHELRAESAGYVTCYRFLRSAQITSLTLAAFAQRHFSRYSGQQAESLADSLQLVEATAVADWYWLVSVIHIASVVHDYAAIRDVVPSQADAGAILVAEEKRHGRVYVLDGLSLQAPPKDFMIFLRDPHPYATIRAADIDKMFPERPYGAMRD
jgi:hypothetical protein